MLYLIGLGLGDCRDISVRGLEVVRRSARVYLECYTSIMFVSKEELEKFYGRSLILADRELVEQGVGEVLELAMTQEVAFLVAGDPLAATTHSDLILRAQKKGVEYRVFHNASIISAVACSGLQLYRFGETVSIVMWTDDWQPDSFADKIENNLSRGLHTLCLLDIKVKEQTVENMMRGNKVFEPPRYQSVSEAAAILLSIVQRRQEQGCSYLLKNDSLSIALARVGSETQQIVSCTLSQLATADLGPPLHCLVIPAGMHHMEEDMVKCFALKQQPHPIKNIQ
ncbi:Diphthine methyl ester synthase-like [Oopsacas minuta]|uniref:diphthine methyl ester synthase n=1 Tax=Oopsacas minuta TaxID=111878 RepID=A0AAV7K060_9METZ|nr:Diphthine methyl ester synthase-like [Oopsacas minuta]